MSAPLIGEPPRRVGYGKGTKGEDGYEGPDGRGGRKGRGTGPRMDLISANDNRRIYEQSQKSARLEIKLLSQ